jgi:DNA-binding transcriptional MerR regulator
VESWRIDDLAQRSGLSVDTIRYYQREGLLPPAERCGRAKQYGPAHLQRLEQIRDLQARRFSLAAIRALLDADRPGLVDGIFADGIGATYNLEELGARSGLDDDLIGQLRSSGLLRDPAEFGRDAYDGDDLDLCCAIAELRDAGLPDDVLVELGRIYADGVEAMQRDVMALFRGDTGPDWSDESLAEFQATASERAPDLLPRVQRVVGYVHHRTLQRLTLGAIERGE